MTWLMLFAIGFAHAQFESSPDELLEGHWLELRGNYFEDGRFVAQSVDLVEPDRYEILVGTVSAQEEGGHFTLLGQRVEIQEKTSFGEVPRDTLEGVRIKLEGYYRSDEKFSAREISPRNEGRPRITGRIDSIRKKRDVYELQIMNYLVEIPEREMVRHEAALSDYQRSEASAQAIVDRNRDEEDRFGSGFWLSENLMVAGQVQTRGTSEEEFNLNPRDPEDRDDLEASVRARFVYQPSDSFFAVSEVNYRYLSRNDEDRGRSSVDNTKLGETYLYWIDPFRVGLDLQLGRVDFDEDREWLYDQNLDAVKAIWTGEYIRAELSYSETLSDGSPLDEAASNSMLYVSNGDDDRHLAAYLIHRDFDLAVPVKRTHYGLRVLGEWLPSQESWLEVSYMDGSTGAIDNRGWALDLGSTWEFHEHFALTAGYAKAQGDDRDSATDHTFHQTGLNDNNGKFAGVTSFRYYGELVDPELANLEIMTAGLGWMPARGISLDLVWHEYRQDELSTRLVDTDLDKRPNGRHKDIGSELDLVFGWLTDYNMDVEIVAAWFKPGKAFDNADDAFLGKLQFRYRF